MSALVQTLAPTFGGSFGGRTAHGESLCPYQRDRFPVIAPDSALPSVLLVQ